MKVHRKRLRLIKGLALAGCTLGLAVPTVAGAMPIDGPLNGGRAAPVTFHPHGRAVVPQANYTLPPSFKTDAQSQAGGSGSRTFVLPAGHRSDVPSATQPSSPTNTTVVREIRNYGGRTLAIVLAAAALGIALCGTGYALSRLALLQRRVVGSSS
jgi:hypothetical protein